MKIKRHSPLRVAFTLVELLVVIAIIAILAALLLPRHGGPRTARMYVCARNLKDLGENFFAWSKAHDGRLPNQVSVTNGGSRELISSGSAIAHFQPLTNSGLVFPQSSSVLTNIEGRDTYVTRWTTNYGLVKRILMCPDDRHRVNYAIEPVAGMADTNISYFVNVSTQLQTTSILAGDRHLLINNEPTKPGLVTISPKTSLGWSKELHGSFEKGNLLFTDGHVEFVKKPASVLIPQGQSSTQLAIP